MQLTPIQATASVSILSTLYLIFFMNVGVDLQDSFYWLNQHRVINAEPFYPASQLIYDAFNYLNFTSYKIFFITTLIIWIVQFAMCAKRNVSVAIGLFVVSLYWFTGILSPDSFSMIGLLGLALYTTQRSEPRASIMFLILIATCLIKITNIILLAPIIIFIAWHQWKVLSIILFSGAALLVSAYFYIDAIHHHVPPNTLLTQYCLQSGILLCSAILIYIITNNRTQLNPLMLVVATTTIGTLCVMTLSHRNLAAVVLGVSIGACIAKQNSKRKILSRKNTFILLLITLAFIGSDTGIYKSIYLLPLLVFLDTTNKNSPFITKLSLALALPLIALKPLYFNYGSSFEGAKIARSIIATKVDPQLTTWAVPNHGTFIVCRWLPNTVAEIDSAVSQLGTNNLSFVGPYSSFFNERYEKTASPIFQGTPSEKIQTKFVIGQHVDQTLFHQVDEFYPGLSLFSRNAD